MTKHTNQTEVMAVDCYNLNDEIRDICSGKRDLMKLLVMTMFGYHQDEICNEMHITRARYHMLKNEIRHNYMRGLAG